MLDIKEIRENPLLVVEGLQKRGIKTAAEIVEEILSIDQASRGVTKHVQDLQSQRNTLASQIGEAKKKGHSTEALMAQASQIREQITLLDGQTSQSLQDLKAALEVLPNLPAAEVPEGLDESANRVVRTWGEAPIFSFTAQPHDVLGKKNGEMDFETAARLSGARFAILKGDLARLERALAHFMLDIHTQEFGYVEVSAPYLVREPAVYGVGQLPKFKEDLFATTDERWLISTGEVSLTNLVREQILEEDAFPLRFVTYTPCFRSEAGAAGKDTRGMIRLHQFFKVELVHIAMPETSATEYVHLMTAAETILQRLGLAYRVVFLCGGDMGFSAQKTHDLEVWLPSQGMYREISSCSHCGDFQARRMGARVRGQKGTSFVHTLNGSGLAVGRTLVALLENYQQEDGSVVIPEALRPYMSHQKRILKNEE